MNETYLSVELTEYQLGFVVGAGLDEYEAAADKKRKESIDKLNSFPSPTPTPAPRDDKDCYYSASGSKMCPKKRD